MSSYKKDLNSTLTNRYNSLMFFGLEKKIVACLVKIAV